MVTKINETTVSNEETDDDLGKPEPTKTMTKVLSADNRRFKHY